MNDEEIRRFLEAKMEERKRKGLYLLFATPGHPEPFDYYPATHEQKERARAAKILKGWFVLEEGDCHE